MQRTTLKIKFKEFSMQKTYASKMYFTPTRIAFIAMFSCLAGVLYIFNFPLSFAFPSFLEFNFSDVPALIGTFTLGPVSGAIIVVVKILIKLVFKSTSTAFVGDLADLIIGLALVVPAGLIYKYKRTFKGALIAMAVGSLCSTGIAILANWLVLVPFYVKFFFGGSWDPIVGMMQSLFPSITKETFYNYYLWVSVVPFNILRCLVAIAITLPVYKRLSRLINSCNDKLAPKTQDGTKKGMAINISIIVIGIVLVIALVVVALVRYYLFN
jgi:riboflavin transporter FmnP